MRRALLALLTVTTVAGTAVALTPCEFQARKTVGHQGRAQRFRKIDAKPERTEPRVCAENETSTDRDPCIGANGRLDYLSGG
jgi:hypothetical protein